MKKSEYKFHRQRAKQVKDLSKPNEVAFWFCRPNPIFIPKRKKKVGAPHSYPNH